MTHLAISEGYKRSNSKRRQSPDANTALSNKSHKSELEAVFIRLTRYPVGITRHTRYAWPDIASQILFGKMYDFTESE